MWKNDKMNGFGTYRRNDGVMYGLFLQMNNIFVGQYLFLFMQLENGKKITSLMMVFESTQRSSYMEKTREWNEKEKLEKDGMIKENVFTAKKSNFTMISTLF